MTVTVPFLDLAAAGAELHDELSVALDRVLRSGWFVLGPEVEAFEAEWASYCGTRHCVGVGNGLDALRLALEAVGVGPGDEVVVPSHTFIATWLAVTALGATVVPAEVDPATYNLSPAAAAAAVTERTRAVVVVHLYGRPADVDAIAAAVGPSVVVVEDAAQAHGIPPRARIASWSFYPGKNLGALGDAGAVTTSDDALAERLRLLRNYGSSAKYVHDQVGVNSRLDEIQAAVLRVKLRHLDEWNARRRAVASAYAAGLADTGLVLPDGESVWHLYVVRSPSRDLLQERLRASGVGTLVHYPTPPHHQGAYSGTDFTLPVAERLANEVLSLPMGPHLQPSQVESVVAAVVASVG